MDTTVGSLITIIAIAVALWFGIRWLVRSLSKYGGPRVVTCPETEMPTIVEVDSLHALLTSTVTRPDIRLKDCARWPIREQCGQECLLDLDTLSDMAYGWRDADELSASAELPFCHGRKTTRSGWSRRNSCAM